MTDAEHVTFTGLLEALAASFRAEVSEALQVGYWMGLSDVPLPAFKAGVQRALRESQFMPTIAEIRKLSGHGKREAVPPYHLPWRDPVKLLAGSPPRDTWPAKVKP